MPLPDFLKALNADPYGLCHIHTFSLLIFMKNFPKVPPFDFILPQFPCASQPFFYFQTLNMFEKRISSDCVDSAWTVTSGL